MAPSCRLPPTRERVVFRLATAVTRREQQSVAIWNRLKVAIGQYNTGFVRAVSDVEVVVFSGAATTRRMN